MAWFSCGCLEVPWAKLQEYLSSSVNLYGDDSAVYAERRDLLELVTQLESIQESRVAVDQCLLADLVRRYDAQKGRIPRAASMVYELPNVEAFEDREYKMLPLPTQTKRPILEGTTSAELLQHLKDDFDVPLHPHFVQKILDMGIKMYRKLNERHGAVLHLAVPGLDRMSQEVKLSHTSDAVPIEPRIVVLGDTHGQLGDVLWAISKFGMPNERNVYVVNGDIADRCDWSTEIFVLFLTIMLQYPNDTVVVINRGNHECVTMNGSRCGGFQYELAEKYGPTWGPALHSLFGQLFALLPLATIIQDTVLILHGGIGRDPENQLESLKERQALNREASINPWGIEGDEAMDALVDALWADPGELPGSQPNPRGAGHVWGPDYTRRFLKSTNLKLVIRSHQVPVDQSGVFVHHGHDSQVITVFSASNHRGRRNRAGAVIISSASTTMLSVVCYDLGICPSWKVLSSSVNLRSRSGLKSGIVDDELISDLLQQSMGLLAEWREPLWRACIREDPQLKGVISLSSWKRICKNTTKLALDWILLARLVGGASINNLRYMETLNRFGFKIASQVVESKMASCVLASIYFQIMQADESLQQLVGKLCQAGRRAAPPQELLDGFDEILQRNHVSGPEMAAVRRSLEAHIGNAGASIDIAEFLSAWKCAAGVRAKLEGRQFDLACQVSRLLGGSKRRWRQRLSSLGAASADTLMEFFDIADVDRDGFVSIEEGFTALKKRLHLATGQQVDPDVEEDLRGLLKMADSTGSGKLNYLEFLSLFDFQDPRSLTHQAMLDLLCFQVWAHRNALSGFFRYVGNNGLISRDQVRWSLEALNSLVKGELLQANIDKIVNAVKFQDDFVSGEEQLRAFQLVDDNTSRKLSV